MYAEDFKHQTTAAANTSLYQSALNRDYAFAFVRSSNTGTFDKYIANGASWSHNKSITSVIAPQWETNSGRIEMVVPLSELSSSGSVATDDWANLVVAIGSNTGSGWQDCDFVQIHYRITSDSQSWLFGNSES